MNNVSIFKYCYGCGVCSASCPKKIISIELNEDGFYCPKIVKESDCIECNVCIDVCSFNHKELAIDAKPQKSWAAWSNDERVRRKSSSGGIGFEICKYLLKKGYKVIGCRYSIEFQRAEHYIAGTVEELVQSMGSKYLQSYTEKAFKQIDRKQKYVVTGTPCQIDSFRRMIQKFKCEENFILMDFYCHCVPSMNAWTAYQHFLEPQIGKVVFASWRNKYDLGWHDSWLMGVDGDKNSKPMEWNQPLDQIIQERRTTIQSRKSQGDLFYKLFLGHLCSGKQCEKNCKFKYDHSSADIRIGDLWGTIYKENKEGVSALVAFTEKGKSIIDNIKEVTLVEHPFEVVAEGQRKGLSHPAATACFVKFLLKHGYSLDSIPFKATLLIQRVISKIQREIEQWKSE